MERRITRRQLLCTAGAGSLATLSLSLLCCRQSLSAAGRIRRQPNIIFILADDLGYADIGCYGQENIKTPNLDRMAAEGMRFTQFYAGSTVCAPSRCCLLTGLHTGHARIKANDNVLLEPEDLTIAEVLKQAGYATGCIGKWGVGHPPGPNDPDRNGFDHFFGYLSMWHAHNYYPEFLWRNGQKVPLRNIVERPKKFYKPDQINLVGVATKKADYAPDMFTEDALQFIEGNRHRPFFLYLPYNIPHANNEAQDRADMGMEVPDYGIYADEDWTQDRKGHAAMVTRMDAGIGRIFAKLKELRLDGDTIVLFSSDNGPHPDCKGRKPCHHGNGPLRGHKGDLYEGGIRVPLIARWPSRIKAGSVSDHISAFWDVMPTLAELADIEPPGKIDGISFLPTLLRMESLQRGHKYLYWEIKRGRQQRRAVRRGKWKAVRLNDNLPLELYDLSTDIGEQHNIASEYPDVVGQLEKSILEAHTE